MISTSRIADILVEVADTLVDDFDVVDFLNRLAARAAEITGWAAVGLMLTDLRGELQYVASSTDDAKLMELLQLQNSEGPCVDCFRSGTHVASHDLASDSVRWPVFAPRAVAAGFASVHAFPLRLREHVIGALNTFGVEPAPLSGESIRLVQALADVATIAIIQERAIAQADLLTEQLQHALNSRLVIEQAKGVVARALGTTVEDAFELLRTNARRERRRLTDLAHEVVTSPDVVGALIAEGLGPRP